MIRTTFLALGPLPHPRLRFHYWCDAERCAGQMRPATALAIVHSPDPPPQMIVFGFWPVCDACRFTMEAELELDQLIGGPTVRDDDVPEL